MERKIIFTPNAPEPIGPYSQGILANNTLFVSGQICIDPKTGKLVEDNITSETEQVMKNIWAILNAANMDFSNVVKCTIFLKSMDDFNIVNAAFSKYFDSDPPARETVEVKKLPKNVNLEISCIAIE